MAQTYVNFKGKGVWIRDSLLELPMGYISDVIESFIKKPVWLKELNSWIKIKSHGEYSGIDLGWDEYLLTNKRSNEFLLIIKKTIELVEKKPILISLDEANSFRARVNKSPTWEIEPESKQVLKVLKILLKLFSDSLTKEDNDYDDFLT